MRDRGSQLRLIAMPQQQRLPLARYLDLVNSNCGGNQYVRVQPVHWSTLVYKNSNTIVQEDKSPDRSHGRSPPAGQPAARPDERAAADGHEQRPDADVPEDAARKAAPLQRALLALEQLVVVRVAAREVRVARRRGRRGHDDRERPLEVVQHDVDER